MSIRTEGIERFSDRDSEVSRGHSTRKGEGPNGKEGK
jgi:hypothetical protein